MKKWLILFLSLMGFSSINFVYADTGDKVSGSICIINSGSVLGHVEGCVGSRCVKVFRSGKYLAVKSGDTVVAKAKACHLIGKCEYVKIMRFKVDGKGKNSVRVAESIVIDTDNVRATHVNKSDKCY